MSEILGLIPLTVNLNGAAVGGTIVTPVFKMPTLALGGGFTLVGATYVPNAATDAGTAHTLEIVNGGTLGTAGGGTAASAIGGTASPFTANAPLAMTLTSSNTFAAGEYVSVRKVQQGATSNLNGLLMLWFLPGR